MQPIKYICAAWLLLLHIACQSDSKKGIEGDSNSGNVVAIGDNNTIVNQAPVQVPVQVDIEGAWNKQAASNKMLTLVNNNYDSVANNYSHEVLNFYNVAYADKEATIGIVYSRPKRKLDANGEDDMSHSCHACGGELSFVEFVKYPNGWKVASQFFRVIEDGQWGEADSEWRVLNIGQDKFGLVRKYGGTGQGYSEGGLAIYAQVGDELKELLDYQTTFDDSGAKEVSEEHFNSDIQVVKQGTGFYDLIVTTEGIKDSKPFKNVNYYKYDGQRYNISNDIR